MRKEGACEVHVRPLTDTMALMCQSPVAGLRLFGVARGRVGVWDEAAAAARLISVGGADVEKFAEVWTRLAEELDQPPATRAAPEPDLAGLTCPGMR